MKKSISIIMAMIMICMGTIGTALADIVETDALIASEAAAIEAEAEKPEFGFHGSEDLLVELTSTQGVTVSYNRSSAVAYAKKFGGISNGSTDNGIFKSRGLDCTNFVSQCLWAGYGGTKGLALTQTEKLSQLVYENFRQTSTWMGRSVKSPYDYPTGPFMRVVELWDYLTTNTGYGPKATGYNNNKLWSQLSVVPQTGDILQIYMSGEYGHSVIVTKVDSAGLNPSNPYTWLDRIHVAQHTYNTADRMLRSIVELNADGYNCKIRLLRPKTAKFSK